MLQVNTDMLNYFKQKCKFLLSAPQIKNNQTFLNYF